MNYYGAKELAASFRTVRKNTVIIAEEIDEQHYGFRATPETRTVAQTLSHIALTPRLPLQIHAVERRTTLEGFDFMGFFGKLIEDEKAPLSKQQLIATLTEEGERFAKWLESVPDDFLGERVAAPAAMKLPDRTRFEMILGVKEH